MADTITLSDLATAIINDKNIPTHSDIATIIPNQTSNSGKFLTTDGTALSWANVDTLPNQASNSGKFLTTNGTTSNWSEISILPSQTGNSGKFLTTDGTTLSWASISTGPVWTDHDVATLTDEATIGYGNKNGALWGNRGKSHWWVEDNMFEQSHYKNLAHARVINGARHGTSMVDSVTGDGHFNYFMLYGGHLTLQPQEKHRYNFSRFYSIRSSSTANKTTKFRISATNDGISWDTLTEFQLNQMLSDSTRNQTQHGTQNGNNQLYYVLLYSDWNGSSGSTLNNAYYHKWRITLIDEGDASLQNSNDSGSYYKVINTDYFLAEIEFG